MDEPVVPKEWVDTWNNLRRQFRKAERQTLEETVADLKSDDPEIRYTAVMALDKRGGAEVLPFLLGALDDPHVKIRGAAARFLGEHPTPEALDAVLDHFYNDPSPHVQLMCSTVLNEWPDDERVRAAYLHLFRSTENKRLISACAGAQRLRIMEAVPFLMQLLDSPEYSPRKCACETLTHLGVRNPRIVAVLEELVDDPQTRFDEQFHSEVEALLREECPEDETAHIPTLREVLELARQSASVPNE